MEFKALDDETVKWGTKSRTKEKDAVVAVEWHHDSRRLIDAHRLDTLQGSGIPDSYLSFAHLAETSRRDSVCIAHPQHAGAFDSAMSITNSYRISTSSRIEQPQLPITTGRDKQRPIETERNALNRVRLA